MIVNRRRALVGYGMLIPAALSGQSVPTLTELESGTTALLQAVSVVDHSVVWISGHDGTVLRTVDGGGTWTRVPVRTADPRDEVTVRVDGDPGPGRVVAMTDHLEYRDIHGFDGSRAVLLSSGTGWRSRIYRTLDAGETWALTWVNDEPDGFYDCLDFWDENRGLLYGDSVDGEIRVLLTADGGATWTRVDPERLPVALPGEGGFAASGTCVDAGEGGRAWIGTGAGTRARALRTEDYGDSWSAVDLPIVSGEAAGAFTIVFSDPRFGVVLGGDLGQSDGFTDNVAITDDGGVTWSPGVRTPLPGAVYGAALARARTLRSWSPPVREGSWTRRTSRARGGCSTRGASGRWARWWGPHGRWVRRVEF